MNPTDRADVPANFGARLSYIIRSKGYRQRDFARKAKVNEASISEYIRGHKTPMICTLVKLKKAAGDGAAYLVGESDTPPPAVVK